MTKVTQRDGFVALSRAIVTDIDLGFCVPALRTILYKVDVNRIKRRECEFSAHLENLFSAKVIK